MWFESINADACPFVSQSIGLRECLKTAAISHQGTTPLQGAGVTKDFKAFLGVFVSWW
jgi:hypothetical protein